MSDLECRDEGEEGGEVCLFEVEHEDGEEGEEGEQETQTGDEEAQPEQNHHQDLAATSQPADCYCLPAASLAVKSYRHPQLSSSLQVGPLQPCCCPTQLSWGLFMQSTNI